MRRRAQATGWRCLVALSGSVLLLVKPHYAVMVLAPALFVCWRHRSLRPSWPSSIGLSASSARPTLSRSSYYPEFVRDVYPVLADVYLKVRLFLPIVTWYGRDLGGSDVPVLAALAVDRVPELASVAALASIAGHASAVLSGQGLGVPCLSGACFVPSARCFVSWLFPRRPAAAPAWAAAPSAV